MSWPLACDRRRELPAPRRTELIRMKSEFVSFPLCAVTLLTLALSQHCAAIRWLWVSPISSLTDRNHTVLSCSNQEEGTYVGSIFWVVSVMLTRAWMCPISHNSVHRMTTADKLQITGTLRIRSTQPCCRCETNTGASLVPLVSYLYLRRCTCYL